MTICIGTDQNPRVPVTLLLSLLPLTVPRVPPVIIIKGRQTNAVTLRPKSVISNVVMSLPAPKKVFRLAGTAYGVTPAIGGTTFTQHVVRATVVRTGRISINGTNTIGPTTTGRLNRTGLPTRKTLDGSVSPVIR